MKTPVVLAMLKNRNGYYFYLYAKDFTICNRNCNMPDIESALDMTRKQEEACNLKIVERLPLLDHVNVALRVALSSKPKLTPNELPIPDELEKTIAAYNSQLLAAYNKL